MGKRETRWKAGKHAWGRRRRRRSKKCVDID